MKDSMLDSIALWAPLDPRLVYSVAGLKKIDQNPRMNSRQPTPQEALLRGNRHLTDLFSL